MQDTSDASEQLMMKHALKRRNTTGIAERASSNVVLAAASRAARGADAAGADGAPFVEHVTALMIAVILQNIPAIKVLLEADPDPRVKNAASQNVFHVAAIIGNPAVMRLLVQACVSGLRRRRCC